MQPDARGTVLLAGAGPGAADLLTVRALRAIGAADVVLYDALVSKDVLALIPPTTRRIKVGKRGHRPSTSQDFINRMMARLARAGLCVLRLKGGDPSIFGRLSEERTFLETQGVAVDVIPGVTTASAAAAQFGFSLTTRAQARRVLFATGRTLDGCADNWRAAADPQTTLCLYMACADIASIVGDLLACGYSPKTPALAAIDVERPGARLIRSSLARLAPALRDARPDGPVFIAIGAVAAGARASARSEAPLPVQDRPACSR